MQLLDRSWLYFPLTREIPPFFVEPHVLPTLHAVCSKPGQPNLPDCSTSLLEVWWPHSGHHWGSGFHESLGDKYELLMWMLLLLLLHRFSRIQLCATPLTATHQAPLSLGFSRKEHWSGLPFPSPSPMHKSEKWKWSRNTKSLCILKLVWLQGGCLEALWPSENQRSCLVWSEIIWRKSLSRFYAIWFLPPSSTFQNSPNTIQRNSTLWVTTFQYRLVWFFWPCNTPCGLWDLSPDQGSNSCPLQWELGVLTTGIPIFSVKAEHPPLWFDCGVLPPTLSPVTCVTLHTSASLSWVSTVITWTCRACYAHRAGPHPQPFWFSGSQMESKLGTGEAFLVPLSGFAVWFSTHATLHRCSF